jgi:hypothetical protein
MLDNVLIVMLTDIKLGDQERNRQIAKLKNLANINRYKQQSNTKSSWMNIFSANTQPSTLHK